MLASCSAVAAGPVGRTGLQLVVDGRTHQPVGRLRRPTTRRWPRPARASPCRPSRRRSAGRRPASGAQPASVATAPATAAAAGTCSTGQPCTRRTQADGSAISARVGSVSGDVQTALKRVHPDLVDDSADERAALDVLRHLHVHPEQRAQQPVDRTPGLAPAVGERRPDRGDRRHHRRARPRPSRGRRAPRAASSAPSTGRRPAAAPATGCPRSRTTSPCRRLRRGRPASEMAPTARLSISDGSVSALSANSATRSRK